MIYGRDRERRQLRESLDDAIADHGSLVLISGEAGIGKTTLVDDLVHEAEQRDCLVLSGGCYDLTTTPPYGPWIEAIGSYDAPANGTPVPEWFRNSETIEGMGSQAQLFEEAREFFAALSADQPLVIVLEDLHWADAASLDALRHIGRRLDTIPLLLITTYRDDEITRRHKLFQLLPALVRESSASRIHIARLEEGALGELISGEYTLNPEDHARLTRYIAALAEGNALYAVELLRTLEEEQMLVPDGDGFVVGDLTTIIVPPLLQQVIERRLTQLDPDGLKLLEIASVIGQSFDFETWTEVSEADDATLLATIHAALAGGVLTEAREQGHYRFSHALIREALYSRQIWPERRIWLRKAAAVAESRPNPDPDVVGHYLKEAGDPAAADWLTKAGLRAMRAMAMATAVERLTSALEIIEQQNPGSAEAAWILWNLAEASRYSSPEIGLDYLTHADSILKEIDDSALEALIDWTRVRLRGFSGESVASDLIDASRWFNQLSQSELERIRSRAFYTTSIPDFQPGLLSQWLSLCGRYEEAITIGEKHLQTIAEASRDVPDSAHTGLFQAYAALGRPEESLATLDLAIRHLARVGSSPLAGFFSTVGLRMTVLPYFADRPEVRADVENLTNQHWKSFTDDFDDSNQAWKASVIATETSWDPSIRLFEQATNISHIVQTYPFTRGFLSSMYRLLGDARRAWDQISHVLPQMADTQPGQLHFWDRHAMQLTPVHLALDEVDLDVARQWLDAYDHWMEWSGAVLGLAEGQLGWARYHRVAGDLGKAREHAELAYEHASDPRQPLALIAADRFLGQIDVDEEKHDDALTHLRASLELAERCEAPFEQALTLVVMAERAGKLGEADEARRLIKRVRGICEPLGAKPTLERVDEIEAMLPRTRRGGEDHPFGLTGREIEVLRLVARGRTDAEAAEELFISPRTVSQHLRNAYNKIGVSNRAEATRVAVEAGIV